MQPNKSPTPRVIERQHQLDNRAPLSDHLSEHNGHPAPPRSIKENAPVLQNRAMTQDDLASVTKILIRLGATQAQAPIMAHQILRRADQIAAERGVERAEALSHLLNIVASGRQGITPLQTPPQAGPTPSDT